MEIIEGALLGGVLISSTLLFAGLVTRSPLLMAYGVVATASMPGAMALVIASDEAFRANK